MRDLEKYESIYLKSNFEKTQAFYRKKMLFSIIEKLRPKNILEVGCGMLSLASYYDDIDFTIIEPSVSFFNNAKESLKNKFNCEILNLNLEEYSNSKNKKFDLVLLSSLIHEIDNPYENVLYAKKMLHKDSILHINAPNALSLHRLTAKEMKIFENVHEVSPLGNALQQKNVFSIDSLIKMLSPLNLEVVENGTYFLKPFTHSQMEKMLDAKIIDQCVLDGLFEITKFFPQYGSEFYINFRLKD